MYVVYFRGYMTLTNLGISYEMFSTKIKFHEENLIFTHA
jgi:hypothetical protein